MAVRSKMYHDVDRTVVVAVAFDPGPAKSATQQATTTTTHVDVEIRWNPAHFRLYGDPKPPTAEVSDDSVVWRSWEVGGTWFPFKVKLDCLLPGPHDVDSTVTDVDNASDPIETTATRTC